MSGTRADSRAIAPPSANRCSRLRSTAISLLCRYVLAGVFLAAAIGKITDLRAFESHVSLRANLPASAEWIVIRILPWLELTCGLCLALGYARREAAAIACALLFLFIVHGLIHWAEPCSCFLFAALEQNAPSWWPTLRNLLLLGCGVRVLCEK
jgi:uncharacterized membrane protein YphA (DoxX/SURF4 family)